jgi:glycine/D-amino acid oxidase-like deaminating enzyme
MSPSMPTLSRRDLLKSAALVPAAAALQTRRHRVVVVGAGAFGGWTALHLRQRGHEVTLLDAYGPGNSRSSSAGGETRVIRGSYGSRGVYTDMVARSLVLWREHQARWTVPVLHEIGAMFMSAAVDESQQASMTALARVGLPFEHLTGREAKARYPQVNFDGLDSIVVEKQAGYLSSRTACQAVAATVERLGGTYRSIAAKPGPIQNRRLTSVVLTDGTTVDADTFVFACGPWMGKLFPDEIGPRILPARQMGLFVGIPSGGEAFQERALPIWIEAGAYYGIPGNDYRGFKIVGGSLSEGFDPANPWNPDTSERTVPEERMRAPREYLARRFPGLAAAPLLESFVCQYENSPDEGLIVDRHPGCDNAWFAGGGSGHGFKFCPAVGELVADLVEGKKPVPAPFALARFSRAQ